MENDNIEVNDVVEDVTETTGEDYKAKYEEAQKEANRLNSLIQKHKDKKTTKTEVTNDVPTFGKEDVDKMLKDSKFYDVNPTMVEHKEQIDKYTSNGDISNEQAMLLVLQADPTIQNRQNTQNANITDGASGGGTKQYSGEDLYKLGQKDPALKRKAMEDIASGKAIETS